LESSKKRKLLHNSEQNSKEKQIYQQKRVEKVFENFKGSPTPSNLMSLCDCFNSINKTQHKEHLLSYWKTKNTTWKESFLEEFKRSSGLLYHQHLHQNITQDENTLLLEPHQIREKGNRI
jgi:hypothetical protein